MVSNYKLSYLQLPVSFKTIPLIHFNTAEKSRNLKIAQSQNLKIPQSAIPQFLIKPEGNLTYNTKRSNMSVFNMGLYVFYKH